MRCPDCNKFASMDFSDPELEGDIDVDVVYEKNAAGVGVGSGTVKCEVHLTRVCADCGTDLKEANLELEAEFDPPPPNDDPDTEHDFEATETDVSGTERYEGKGRGLKSFFGAEVSFTVKCSCGCGFEHEGTMTDEIQASHMDELT